MSSSLDEAERLFTEGEELADDEQDEEALVIFRAALDALPKHQEQQDLAIRIFAAVADRCFFLGDWDGCRDAVQHAFRSGAGVDNLFLRLRLGQALYEQGQEAEAANWLVPVYLMEGRRLFEDDDPKYLDFFRGQLVPPPGGWGEGW